MSKTRTAKEELLKMYQEMITYSAGYILVSSDKIDTATITALKKDLQTVKSGYTVVKNNIFKIALQENNQPLQLQEFSGPTAVIFFNEDPTQPAKLIKKIQKNMELLAPRCGVYENEFLTDQRVMELADIPSREVLLSRLVGTMNAPLTGFMNAVTGNIRSFTILLNGISEKKANIN
jgi:large subunit ribosomal protein L10